jgi:hypothetical protein
MSALVVVGARVVRVAAAWSLALPDARRGHPFAGRGWETPAGYCRVRSTPLAVLPYTAADANVGFELRVLARGWNESGTVETLSDPFGPITPRQWIAAARTPPATSDALDPYQPPRAAPINHRAGGSAAFAPVRPAGVPAVRPKLELAGATVTLRRRRVLVKVACWDSGTCAGSVRLLAGGRRVGSATARHGRRPHSDDRGRCHAARRPQDPAQQRRARRAGPRILHATSPAHRAVMSSAPRA